MLNWKILLNRTKNALLLQEGSDIDNYIVPPQVNKGTILLGILLRTAIIIIVSTFIILFFEKRELWWIATFVFWLTVAYPAYRQWNLFSKRVDKLKETTMCGKCRYFISESQLCAILDEHIGNNSIPCNGESWEANPNMFATPDEDEIDE